MSKTAVTSKELIFYKKKFPLEKGLTFSHYMKAVDNLDFTPYVLVIEKTSKENVYQAEVVYAPSTLLMSQPGFGLADTILRPIVLNKLIIKYLEGKREILLEAYHDSEWTLHILVSIGLILVIFISAIFETGSFYFSLPIIIMAWILLMIFRRDKRRLEAIGKLTMKSTENIKGT